MSIQFDSVKPKQEFNNADFVEVKEVQASAKEQLQQSAAMSGIASASADIAKTAAGVAIGVALADLVSSLF